MMKILLILSFLLQAAGSACPGGWKQNGQSCYLFSHDKEDWPGAYTMCTVMNAHLVEIDDIDENKFLVSNAQSEIIARETFWMGLSDTMEEGVWTWMTSRQPSTQYTNWAPDQPSIVNSFNQYGRKQENCANFHGTQGFWSDALCSLPDYYICEKRAQSAPIVG
ncbi:perlucin-like protein [Mercenaria mercenaria]|uniref:perlucin-like protein n=1 Tax=Mercenaria mercenaria TaxID=6596 RepID=UPI00234E799A|nr:perlucin-like protein [Mercenaria mercenaria]